MFAAAEAVRQSQSKPARTNSSSSFVLEEKKTKLTVLKQIMIFFVIRWVHIYVDFQSFEGKFPSSEFI